MENKKSKLVILETDNGLTINIPPPKFSNYLSTIFLVCNSIVFIFVLVGITAAYYADIVFKIAMIIFLISGLKLAQFNIIFIKEMFFNTTQLNVSPETVHVTRSIERESNNFLSIPIEEITAIRLSKSHTDSKDIFPQLFFVTKDYEYSLHRYTGFYFSNDEIMLLANKISDYIGRDILN